MLLAVVGPQLAGVQPTDGELLPLTATGVRNIAPRDLTLRFDENQQIDPTKLDGIRIYRSGLDGDFTNGSIEVIPGYKGVGAAPNQNEVVVRFADSLPDDLYRVELYGIDDAVLGHTALRNTRGEAFGDTTADGVDNGHKETVEFELELGPQVLAVVPQPVTQISDPADSTRTILSQARNQIVVYFNDDDLFVEHDALGQPTQRSAENPDFYRLIFTRDTVQNTDDITFFPETVTYDPDADTATLTFAAADLDQLVIPSGYPDAGQPIGSGTWRLRVGTDEALPAAPVTVAPEISQTTDFGTAGTVSVTFTATGDFGKAVALSFTRLALGAGVPPRITVVGNEIRVVLNTSGSGTTAGELRTAIMGDAAARSLVTVTVAGAPATPIAGTSLQRLSVAGLGSSYDTAYDLGPLTAQSLLVPSSIDPQDFALDLPGGYDEPGHRVLPDEVGSGFEQHINPAFGADTTAGVTTILYSFRQVYGYDAQGNPLSNLITEKQKLRVREGLELWAKQLGVQFLETDDQGLTFVTGDPRALDPNDSAVLDVRNNGFIVRVDPQYTNGMIILDSARQWNSDFGGDWFNRLMVGIGAMLGLQRSNDLPVTNLMAFGTTEPYQGSLSSFTNSSANVLLPEPVYPGNADVIHGQYIHRPDSNDIDLYRFTIDLNDAELDEQKSGLLTVESFAERLPNSSSLDSVLSLYREVAVRDQNGAVVGYERALIARNDNYYGSDSFIELDLGSGTYYLGVTAAGNTDFDPVIEDTGYGGTTQGAYEVRLNFRSQVDDEDTVSDEDRLPESRPGSRLDGDGDGVPGGVFNFWFQTRPLERVIDVTGDGNTYVDGQTLTIEDAFGGVRWFEFDSNSHLSRWYATPVPFSTGTFPTLPDALANELANAINSSGLQVSATQSGPRVLLTGERSAILNSGAVGIELEGKTIFVDKTSGTNLHGTLDKPFDNISAAFAAAVPGDIVRIVGNGGSDGNRATLKDNYAYEIGFGSSGGPATLSDGSTMDVPAGVTTMIDAGAIFKLRRARIGVGSSSASVDRSGGALQVLGTPHERVYFTSYMDESTGRDTNPLATKPAPGDWGGLVFRADLDNADARFNYEDEGVFLNYVSHADLRYGGGLVRIDNIDQVVNPIQMAETRPTIIYNSVGLSADAAMSADPDSFEETNFLSPQYQLVHPFTPDYERVGPDIHGNRLSQNSLNGLFVRIKTPAGTELEPLTVSGRFDDTDIVHIIAENLMIQSEAGKALLETERPPVDLVTLGAQVGGSLTAGVYNYKLVFVDRNGFEGRPSEATLSVDLPAGYGSLRVSGLPPVSGNFVGRRLYRSQPGGSGPYNLVAELDAVDVSWVDRGTVLPSATLNLLERDPPSVLATALAEREITPTTEPGVPQGTYNYRVVLVDDATGEPGPASDATNDLDVNPPVLASDNVRVVDLTGLPATPAGYTQLVYRSATGGSGPYTLVGSVAAGGTFTDVGVVVSDSAGEPIQLDPQLTGVVRARPDARLKIDPGAVVKLEGARIEVTFGAQLIAEGLDGKEVIFTSKLDDRYGAGGTFDTNKDGIAGTDPGATGPSRGDWGGIYVGHLGQLSLDHAYVAFGGGNNVKIEGTFKGFNVIELHQAEARIVNSVIEQNARGTGGQGPADRFGRGANDGATIFIRGAQPVIVDNIIRDNDDVAITINADSFTHELLSDSGRVTGDIDQIALYRDNRGPLVRGNMLENNGRGLGSAVGTNGMEIRTAGVNSSTGVLGTVGITLSDESVWDDTDIVHILYDELRVPNLHVYGGLQLRSSSNESLVVKMAGAGAVGQAFNNNPLQGAGFVATGVRYETEDRVGGTLYVIGQPGFPVVLTSIHDDSVGAGVQPDGTPQTDTNNNGTASVPQPGDWRSVRLDQFSHDRNVEMVFELEEPDGPAPGLNGVAATAQFLGELAPDESSGDGDLRLGFQVDGFLNAADDIDYYSFTATPGTEIWFDIDRSRYASDTVIELLDAKGQLIALSDNSQSETIGPSGPVAMPSIASGDVNPLQKLSDVYQPHHIASGLAKDVWGTNSRDAGMRVVLPGAQGSSSSYLFRVRSSNLSAADAATNLLDTSKVSDGLTSGVYQLQVRMREADEVPGSTVRYADIRYAQNGVEVIGLPAHSPLLGEAAEDEQLGFTAGNGQTFVDPLIPGIRAQELGNLFTTDRGTLSIAGGLSGSTDVDFYKFDVSYDDISDPSAHHGSVAFDMDYADGLSRPDTTMVVFQENAFNGAITPVLIARDSNVSEDRPLPVLTATDQSGMYDLSRGSAGSLDPFIGSVELPEGTYYVAVVSDRELPTALSDAATRLEPIDSLIRIAEDHINSYGGSTAVDPVVPYLVDPTFDGSTKSPTNLWHVSTREASQAGHGLTGAFDNSRLNTTAGSANENEANDAIASAQNLEGGLVWSLDYNADVGDFWGNTSTAIPHMTVTSRTTDNNDTFDYYSFSVTTVPARGIFDIDYGITGNVLTDVDTDLVLFDAAGAWLDWGPSGLPSSGAGGSTSVSDGYLEYTFTRPGTYVIGVGGWPSFPANGGINGQPVPTGRSYTLQLSVEDHPAIKTTGSGGETFYFGNKTGGYNLGAGKVASGSLQSNAFSLQDYSAADKPVLYFNYRLNADTGDFFRVYVQRSDGTEALVASSSAADIKAGVQLLTNDDVWRQCRSELDLFAGLDQVRLRFDFTAADATPGAAQGVHIDDLIIGFAERGEMITNAPNNTAFAVRQGYNTSGRVLSGEYQLEIRKATDYGLSYPAQDAARRAVDGLILQQSFDTNDRLTQQMTLVVPAGRELVDGQTFSLGDGSGMLTFEFDLTTNGIVTPGNVRVPFLSTDADYTIAAAIRNAINSPAVQGTLDLQAALSDGTNTGAAGRSNKINLIGNAVADFAVVPGATVLGVQDNGLTDATAFGNLLRDRVLGTGFTPQGDATFVGGADATSGTFTSAGVFTDGGYAIGMDTGIVLATGAVSVAEGPNVSAASSGTASGLGDADLDAAFFSAEPPARRTMDATSLQFTAVANFTGTAYFNFVFASEEYNEQVAGTDLPDAMAVFVTDLTAGTPRSNVALVPGTTQPVSRKTINGGSPLGNTANALNPKLYNNNDYVRAGAYLRELGYDGFTDVLTGGFAVTAGHTYTFKFAIGDAVNQLTDSAVFIQAGTLGSVNPTPLDVDLYAVLHDGYGDANVFRDQGQVLIHSNTITDAADFAIVADAGERDVDPNDGVALAEPHLGPTRNLRELNGMSTVGMQGGFTPGVTIANNTLSGGGLGGVHVSGNLRPYEIVPLPGDSICDGDYFSVTMFRTTVVFEFEDLSTHSTSGACPANVLHGDGWTPGRVPVYYLMVAGAPELAVPYHVSSQADVADAIADAITRSILVENGTTLAGEANVGPSRRVGSAQAAYADHARDVLVPSQNHNPLQYYGVVPMGQAAQPFVRVVNNTIYGNDGNAPFFPGDPNVEPNETILNAVDTRQGRAASPETFTANAQIGDGSDVDMYSFHLDVNDRVTIDVTTPNSGLDSVLRLFDATGQELQVNDDRAAGNADPYLSFTATEGGTYFVGISSKENNAYSPLSLGSRQAGATTGRYTIVVDVLAPRRWVVDTRPLVNTSGTFLLTDINGRTFQVAVGTANLLYNTPGLAWDLKTAINGAGLSGVSAEDYGGPETPTYPLLPTRRQDTGDGRRYVLIRGAVKIEALDGPAAAALRPTLDVTNEDGVLPETGVLISEQSTPTLLNNVLANHRNEIVETNNQPTASSPLTAVVGAELFQHSTPINGTQNTRQFGNWRESLQPTGSWAAWDFNANPEYLTGLLPDTADFNIALGNRQPLFVNAPDGNFYPAASARSVDSSVDSLEDRPPFIAVKSPMGISNSPILAPVLDATGQTRRDDPAVAPPLGQGQDVFKDRGSLDRSDFVGPSAILAQPRDNDTEGIDEDPTSTVVQLAGGSYKDFQIQVVDGFETADPFPGVGVNDATIVGPGGLNDPEGRFPGAAITVYANGVFLEEGIDYTFRYDATSNVIQLAPTAGVWPDDQVYVVRLNNRDRFVINAPVGDASLDRETFQITNSQGATAVFQFDSGYTIQMPQTLALEVPAVGAGSGGATDGQRFTIRDASDAYKRPVTFELDVNNSWQANNIRVQMPLNATQTEVADALVTALNGAAAQSRGLTLTARNIGGGGVHLGAPAGYVLDTTATQLSQPATILTLAVPAVIPPVAGVLPADADADVQDGQTFQISDGAATVTFEFDRDNIFNPANRRVVIGTVTTMWSVAAVADQVVLAIQNAGLNLNNVQHIGGGQIYLHTGAGATVTALSANVFRGYVSRPLVDGESFTVSYDGDGDVATAPLARTFEFDDDSLSDPAADVIPFTLGDTHEDLAQRVGDVVRNTGVLNLPTAKHVGGGLVYLGGSKAHTVVLSTVTSLQITGQPDYDSPTTLHLPSSPTIIVPANGAAGLTRNLTQTFTITDASQPNPQTETFQFTDGTQVIPTTSWPVVYGVADDAAALAEKIRLAIMDAMQAGTFLNGVQPTVVVNNGTVGVELTNATSYHALDVSGSLGALTSAGGHIADGDLFQISYAGLATTFEFDNNGILNPAYVTISFGLDSTLDQIGAATVAAINTATSLQLSNVRYVGSGVIELHDTTAHIVGVDLGTPDLPPSADTLTKQGLPGGAVRIPFEPWAQFNTAAAIIDAINQDSGLGTVTASLRGPTTLFVDFSNLDNSRVDFVVGPATVTGISNYFLRTIQDYPGNWLKANQFTGETQFTIIMPGAELDFGDAWATNRPSQYPTEFAANGARHVIAGDLYLGNRVDGERDGQPVPPGLGDNLDQVVDLGDSPFTVNQNAPLTIHVPAAGVPNGGVFGIRLSDGSVRWFEFDEGGDGVAAGSDYAVVYPAGATVPVIADAIATAVTNANLGLQPMHLGAGDIALGGTQRHRIDTGDTDLVTEGVPPYSLAAVPGSQLVDGETFMIWDGVSVVPWVFEFDKVDEADKVGVAAGNVAVPFTGLDTAVDVAESLFAAVDGSGVAVTLTNIGDGTLHVAGTPSHAILFDTSTLEYATRTPLTLTVPGAGLGFRLTPKLQILVQKAAGGALADTQSFMLSEGTNRTKFEFDSNGALADGDAHRIVLDVLSPYTVVAETIRAAIQGVTGLTATVDNTGDPTYVIINLGAGMAHGLDTSASNLHQRIAVADGQTFRVDDGVNPPVTFEFDSSGASAGRPVAFLPSYSANDVANALIEAVKQAQTAGVLTGLNPKNLGAGNVQIGGHGAVNPGTTTALAALGMPNGILDGQTFHLIGSVKTLRFEFDANGQATPGNITVPFQVNSTADDIGAAVTAAIAGSGFSVNAEDLGGGLVALDGGDEDGVRFERVFTAGATVPITVTASAAGYLDGWVDFNGDGDWYDPSEQVFASVRLQPGANSLSIPVPTATGAGVTFARFRFSSTGGLQPTGLGTDGEVEDYRIEIISNDPPQITAPQLLLTDEDAPLAIAGLRMDDPDALTGTMAVTLSVLHGTLTVLDNVPYGLISASISGNGTATVVLRGTVTEINSTLSFTGGLTYLNTPDYNGGDRLTVVADDLGNTGSGGPQHDVALVPITIAAVNDRPVVAVPSSVQTTEEDLQDLSHNPLPLVISGIDVTDVDVNDGPTTGVVTVSLTAVSGTITVTVPASGLTVAGNGRKAVTLVGELAAIRMALGAGVAYQSDPNFNGSDTLTVTADDGGSFGSGGPGHGTGTVSIDITAINDAPQFTVPPGSLTTGEDIPLPMAGFDLVDVDSGTALVTVTLNISDRNDSGTPNGTLTINSVPGGVDPLTQVTDNGSDAVTITAPQAAIGATLRDPAGWSYLPPLNYGGTATAPKYEILTLNANDGGATGIGGPLGDSRMVTIFVTQVNDPPEFTPAWTTETIDEDAGAQTYSGWATGVKPGPDSATDEVGQALAFSTALLTTGGDPALRKLTAADFTQLPSVAVGTGDLTFQIAANRNGQALVLVTLTDDGGTPSNPADDASTAQTVTITVSPVNDQPQVSVLAGLSVVEDRDLPLPGITVADPDVTEAGADGVIQVDFQVSSPDPNKLPGQLTVTASPALGLTVTANATAHVTVGGTLAHINSMLAAGGLSYRGAAHMNGEVILTITANDLGKSPGPTALTGSNSLTITVAPDNDPPVITAPASTTATEDLDHTIAGISIADVDLLEVNSAGTGAGEATLGLSALHGTLNVDQSQSGSVVVTNDGSRAVTLAGPLAEINKVLAVGVVYHGDLNYNGGDSVTITANDNGNSPQPARIAAATIAVTVTAVNDPPLIVVPSPQTLNEDASLTFPPITITDADVGETAGAKLKVILGVTNGQLTIDLNVAGGLRWQNITGATGGLSFTASQITISGTQAQINATLNSLSGLTYKPNKDFNGNDTLTVTANDNGNTGGSAEQRTETVPIAVKAVNDPPVITLPAQFPITDEDVAVFVRFPANAVHDVDAADAPGNGLLSVTLTAGWGVITVSTGVAGGLQSADFGPSGSGGTEVTFTAKEAAINATLSNAAGVSYKPNTNVNGKDTIVLRVNDLGNTDADVTVTPNPKEASGTVTVTVRAMNDVPELTAPAGPLTVNEDTDLALAGFHVSDVDASEGTGDVRLLLNVFQGTLQVKTDVAGGLGTTNVQGNGTNAVTVTGTPDQINATLAAAAGVVYRGVSNFSGQDALDVTLTDQLANGTINYGLGAAGVITKRITIYVTPVNDAPTVTIAAVGSVTEDQAAILAVTVDDVEINDPLVQWSATLSSSVGKLSVLGGIQGGVPTANITGNNSGTVTLTGTGKQIKTTLETAHAVGFLGNANVAGPGSVVITITDPGPVGTSTVTSTATATFSIAAVNDAPTLVMPSNLVVLEDTQLLLSGANKITVQDVDSGAGAIVVTIQVVRGTLTVNTGVTNGLQPADVSGNGTGAVVVTATEFAIGTTFADATGLAYRGDPDFFGIDQLSVTVDDRGHTGAGGILTAVGSAIINVTSVNDPPRIVKPIPDKVVAEDSPVTEVELFPGVFADADDTSLTFRVSNSDPTLVEATIAGTKLILRNLPNQCRRQATIQVWARDAAGAESPADEFTVDVTPVPDAPFVANLIADVAVLSGTTTYPVRLTGVSNGPLPDVFSDPDFAPNDPAGDVLTLSFTGNSNPALVSGQLVGNVLQLTFNTALYGRADLTVTATDTTGRSVSDTFTVFVSVPPVALNDAPVTNEDTAVGISVFANDSDPDGTVDRTTVVIVAASGPSHGTVQVNPTTGVVTYTPAANYYNYDPVKQAYVGQPDSFRYTIKDNSGFVSNEATVAVTVKGLPDYQNPDLNADVNRSGSVSPIDALVLINYINTHPIIPPAVTNLPPDPEPPAVPEYYLDVNGDGAATGADVVIVVNYLNSQTGAGEGEFAKAAMAVPDETLALPATAPPSAGAASVQAGTVAKPEAAASGTTGLKDSAFAAIGSDTAQLMDLGLGEVLSAIADDVDDAQDDPLAEDWVLSGRQL